MEVCHGEASVSPSAATLRYVGYLVVLFVLGWNPLTLHRGDDGGGGGSAIPLAMPRTAGALASLTVVVVTENGRGEMLGYFVFLAALTTVAQLSSGSYGAFNAERRVGFWLAARAEDLAIGDPLGADGVSHEVVYFADVVDIDGFWAFLRGTFAENVLSADPETGCVRRADRSVRIRTRTNTYTHTRTHFFLSRSLSTTKNQARSIDE